MPYIATTHEQLNLYNQRYLQMGLIYYIGPASIPHPSILDTLRLTLLIVLFRLILLFHLMILLQLEITLSPEQYSSYFSLFNMLEVGGFYWSVLAPDIVKSGREKQGSISM